MVSLAEQETVIQFNRDSKECNIWTSDSTMITKLDKRCKTSPEYYTLTKEEHDQDGNIVGKFYKLTDKGLISLRSTKRVLTEEQKQMAAERLRNMRKNADSSQPDVGVENLDDEDDKSIDEDMLDE